MTQNAADRLNTPRAWAVDLAACAVTGMVLGAVGPFGSFFNDGLAVRIGYWTAVLWSAARCSALRSAGSGPGCVADACPCGSGCPC